MSFEISSQHEIDAHEAGSEVDLPSTGILDRAEEFTGSIVEKIKDKLPPAREQPVQEGEIQDLRVQRRVWQVQDDAEATGEPIPAKVSIHPMGPEPTRWLGRMWHRLNRPA